MVAGSVVLSIVTLLIDYSPIGSRLAREFSWIWSGQADGARSVLSTIASSMITVAGTVFSITIAALALTSSQFGPRLLRNFTRDVGNQVVLGTFLATFLYSLLILRTVHDGQGGQGVGFVPNLSVTAAVALAAASTGVLIYFIHHLTGSIQAETLIAAVAEDLKGDIARLRPPAPPGPGSTPMDRRDATPRAKPALVHSTASGYLRHVDRDGLVEAGDEYDMLIRTAVRPGISCPKVRS